MQMQKFTARYGCMLSCGWEPPTDEIVFGANWAESVGVVSVQRPSGSELESQVLGPGVAVFSTTPPDPSSWTVITWVCEGVCACVSVTLVTPWGCPITVVPPGPVPQCIGTWPCRLGKLKVVVPLPP